METDQLPDIVCGKNCNMWTVSEIIVIFIKTIFASLCLAKK
jgi:hypothetical protein